MQAAKVASPAARAKAPLIGACIASTAPALILYGPLMED